MDLICFFVHFSTSDWISIINILVTSAIGIWIGVIVQRNLATNRALKEYFMSEINGINLDYMSFLKKLYSNRVSSKNVQEWFKIMNIRIEVVESSIKSQLNIKPLILENHIKLKQFITNLEEFGNCYRKEHLILSPTSKNEILEINRCFKNAIVKLIVDINKGIRNREPIWRKSYWRDSNS